MRRIFLTMRNLPISLLTAVALYFISLNSFAFHSFTENNSVEIHIDNHSSKEYSLIIYGSGTPYEVNTDFNSIRPNQSGCIKISYTIPDTTRKFHPAKHTVMLQSEKNHCKVLYSAHPTKKLIYLPHTQLVKSKLHSQEGSCKAWQESKNIIHIELVEIAPSTISKAN